MLKKLLFAALLLFTCAAQATVYSLPWGPKPQFIDANGVPMSSGTVTFYAAGSTTPQNTYTDSTGGVANANPITLNTRGESPNEVWLTGGQIYKLVLKDSAGVTVWTVDNVSGVNDITISNAPSEWIAGPAPTYVGATQFTLAGDQTQTFTVGRRVKTTNSGGTVYSIITASAFGVVTTVTISSDSSALDAGLSAVSYGMLASANSSVPHTVFSTTQFAIRDAFALPGVISPTQITSNQNDYAPTSLSTATLIRLTTDASRNVTGLTGGASGRLLTIYNVGSFPIVFTNEDAGSSAANRFTVGADTTLNANESLFLQYDSTTSRWRKINSATKRMTITSLTSGSGTYTTPTGATRLRVRAVGGGAGGGGSAGNGTAGNNTTFGTLTASGGGSGVAGSSFAGVGGAASGGDINITGGGGNSSDAIANARGGNGGSSVFGGAGRGAAGAGNAGQAAEANSGSGGGGSSTAAGAASSGGGSGGYLEKSLVGPAATYTYAVGASAAGGTAGGGSAGGVGAAGIIIIEEFYD